jgi:hypothetical protein
MMHPEFWIITPQKSTQLVGAFSSVPDHALNSFFIIQIGLNA